MTSFLTAARAEQEKQAPDSRRLRLFSGTSNPALAKEISAYLGAVSYTHLTLPTKA